MFDSYDYPSLVESAFFSRELDRKSFSETIKRNLQGDEWENQGDDCQPHTSRACAHAPVVL